MKRLAGRLQQGAVEQPMRGRALRLFWPGLAVRNVVFLVIVLVHGFRRLLPPY
jgi:hypothetical protein